MVRRANLKKKLKRLDNLFVLTGSLFLIFSLVVSGRTLAINAHDTYFVIPYLHIGVLGLLFCGFYALLYLLIRRYQLYALGLLHLIFTTPFLIYILLKAVFLQGGAASGYPSSGEIDLAFNTGFATGTYLIIIAFLIGQLLALINILVSLVRMSKSRTGK